MATPDELLDKVKAILAQKGINVLPDAEIIADPDPMDILGVLCSKLSTPVNGAKPYPCNRCKRDVWMAPSSQALLEGRKAVGHESTITCSDCFANERKN